MLMFINIQIKLMMVIQDKSYIINAHFMLVSATYLLFFVALCMAVWLFLSVVTNVTGARF